ncbi:hypothetical protein ACSMX9_12850 [Streptomyces sp. LE64]|uniref:hypothetical protein n=1 Tax=Streptomyces sp. LE64 TaxID=3448653 RepID=UPI004042329A
MRTYAPTPAAGPVPLHLPELPEVERLHLARVFAEGQVAGTGLPARFVLGTFASPSPRRVLRWLRRQALRIADGLDPDPSAFPSASPAALRRDPAGRRFGDVPTALRAWARDDGPWSAAHHRLAAGEPFHLVEVDHTGRYALTAWSVDVPTPVVPSRQPSPLGRTHDVPIRSA